MMRTGEHIQQLGAFRTKQLMEPLSDETVLFQRYLASRDAGLVRDDDGGVASACEPANRSPGARQQGYVVGIVGVIPVHDDGALAVKQPGNAPTWSSPRRRERPRHGAPHLRGPPRR